MQSISTSKILHLFAIGVMLSMIGMVVMILTTPRHFSSLLLAPAASLLWYSKWRKIIMILGVVIGAQLLGTNTLFVCRFLTTLGMYLDKMLRYSSTDE